MFVGREAERGRLLELIRGGARIVTVVGPGGAGKTRFVRELIARGDLGSACFWIDLAGAETTQEIALRLGAAIDCGMASDGSWSDEMERLSAALEELGPATIVFDEAETVIDPLARCLERWAQASIELCFISTTRRSLDLLGESTVAMLGLPDAVGTDLYRRLAARKTASPIDEPAVQSLLARIAHLPLGIELAAARAGTEDARALMAAIDRGDDRLVHLGHDVPARHRSFVACIAWSLDTLPTPLKDAALELSLIRGFFGIRFASAILGAEGGGEGELARVSAVVESLAGRALVETKMDHGELMLRMLEPIRELAFAALVASGRREVIEARRAEHLAAHAPKWAAELHDGEGIVAARSVGARKEDLLQAIRWALEHRPALVPALAIGIDAALVANGPAALHEEVMALAFAATTDSPRAQSELLRLRARARFLRGQHADSWADIEAAWALGEGEGDSASRREIAILRSAIARESGDPSLALSLAERTFKAAEADGDAKSGLRSLHNRASAEALLGQADAARLHFLEAIERARRADVPRLEGLCLINLGLLDRAQGNLAAAAHRADQSIAVFEKIGDRLMAAKIRAGSARIAAERGDLDGARARVAAVRADGSQLDDMESQAELRLAEAEIALRSSSFGAARVALEDALAFARQHAIPEIVSAALARLATLPPPEAAPTEPPRFLVGAGAYWFAARGQTKVSLGRRPSLRRILARLVDAHLSSPGTALGVDELIEAGWPRQRLLADSGPARVYTAIKTLRDLGWRDVLIQRDGGYLLDRETTIARSITP